MFSSVFIVIKATIFFLIDTRDIKITKEMRADIVILYMEILLGRLCDTKCKQSFANIWHFEKLQHVGRGLEIQGKIIVKFQFLIPPRNYK